MNVKRLKDLIRDLPDNITVVTLASDHSYREAFRCNVTESVYHSRYGQYDEYYGESLLPNQKMVNVLLID
jgi:hypothetical protein